MISTGARHLNKRLAMPYPSLNKKKDAHFEWASFFVYLNTFMRSALPSPTLILAVLPGRTSWLIPYWYPDCISALCKGYFTFSMLIFRKRFTGNIKLCSVYLYHFTPPQKLQQKRSYRFGNSKNSVVPPNILVSGIPTLALSKSGSRSKVTPSSQPVYKLPFI